MRNRTRFVLRFPEIFGRFPIPDKIKRRWRIQEEILRNGREIQIEERTKRDK